MSVYRRFNGIKLKSAKDPNWSRGTWYCYKRINGQVIHKSLPEAQTKAQAEQAERKLIEAKFNRKYGGFNDTTTFSDFCDTTYTKYVEQNNVNVYVKKLFILELKKFFRSKLLSDITPQDCRDYQYKRLHTKTKHGEKRKPSSVNKEMSTLSKIFTLACQERILQTNPMQYVKKLEEPKSRERLLSSEEKERFWRELEKDRLLKQIVILAVNIPLRRGQILSITKESVDFDKRLLLASASKGKEPRSVPLNRTALATLSEMCATVESGLLIPVKKFEKRWAKCLLNAGINKENDLRENNFHFHDLRHWLGSELLSKNINPLIIQSLFGHSEMAMTRIYTNAADNLLFDAVNSLDNVIAQESDLVQ